jgi:hypothetical protein
VPYVNDANYIVYHADIFNDIATIEKILKEHNIDYDYILLGAASENNLDIVKHVINFGANEIDNAFTEAVSNNSFDTVKYLWDNYQNKIDVQNASIFVKSVEMVELLSSYLPLNIDYIWSSVYHNNQTLGKNNCLTIITIIV